MIIREATLLDEDGIRDVHKAAFGEGEDIGGLACELLHEGTTPDILHLIALKREVLIGHVAFSPVKTRPGTNDYLLAPLGVDPNHQKAGVGSKLVREGLRLLKGMGAGTVLVYGDPDYYGRFGFKRELAEKFEPPFELKYPFGWQALNLNGNLPPDDSNQIDCVASLNKEKYW